jgi:signal transduction histidine kinase
MDIKSFIGKSKREFTVTIALIGVIPLLVSIYLVASKLSNINILVGQVGIIVFCTTVIFVAGVLFGKKMFDTITAEVIEKSRLAAISETVLGMSDQINNPLMVIRGNMEMLESFALESRLPQKQMDRIKTIQDNLENIRQASEHMAHLNSSKTTTIYGNTKMVDFSQA